jgi:hypothetical protein
MTSDLFMSGRSFDLLETWVCGPGITGPAAGLQPFRAWASGATGRPGEGTGVRCRKILQSGGFSLSCFSYRLEFKR